MPAQSSSGSEAPDGEERAQASAKARSQLARRPLYLDTETTGLDAGAEIVELCLVDDDGAPVFETFVRPIEPIPAGATAVHGITDDMVASAPTWPEVFPELQRVIAGRSVGIYNADYDLRLIRQVNARHGLARDADGARAFCIMQLYSRWYGERHPTRGDLKWHKLEVAGRRSGIDLPNSHRARADALLARALLHYMAGPVMLPATP